MKPVLFGCSGKTLTYEERLFFSEFKPFGFILFQRNCETPNQVLKLVQDFREAVDNIEVPVFIDQEGGRVARLKPPLWPALPPLRSIGCVYERDKPQGIEAMRLHARLTAHMLSELGITGNCAPVLDLFIENASSAIGDRAMSRDPEIVSILGRVAVESYLESGIIPVIKHLPGHGRVLVDPHQQRPIVDTDQVTLENEDFKPFQYVKDAPIGMNCHVVFKALDPKNPVSMSVKIHKEIIRGKIGFQGLVFSDDLAMKALNGPLPDLANKALAAGADIALYCAGDLEEMKAIAKALPEMSDEAKMRWQKAQKMIVKQKDKLDFASNKARLDLLIG